MKVTDGFVTCLVKDAISEYCCHRDCIYLHKDPISYFERKSEQIKRRQDFTYFEMHKDYDGTKWIMPVNPYQENMPERNKFELFRQGHGEFRLWGRSPDDRFRFHRDEISYKYITVLKDRWMIPENASIIDLMELEEVDEVAYFNGPV